MENDMNSWIPVTEQLPQVRDVRINPTSPAMYLVSHRVMICDDEGHIDLDYYHTGSSGTLEWKRSNRQNVTHWRPLPKPPKR